MRILVVEDDSRIAANIKKGFEQERWVVDVAETGAEGLDLALQTEYSVLVVDYLLPILDGVALCRELRAQKISTPILMLTAKTQIADRVTGLDAGADDYLGKPFAFEELVARVRALARRPRATAHSPKITVRDLSLDPQNFEVTRQNASITLTQKEFQLLEFLMQHAGAIMSKDQILNHVWNLDSAVTPNTIEVYVRSLRKKIEDPFPKLPRLIRTVRGFGYTLEK